MDKWIIIQDEQEIVWESGMSKKQVALLSRTVLKGFSEDEMWLAFFTAKSMNANIFAKEMRAVKDGSWNVIFIASRDFLLKKAHENPKFDTLQAGAIYNKDNFCVKDWVVTHEITWLDRWVLEWAWATAWSVSWKPYTKIAKLSVYKKDSTNKYIPWNKDPESMIIKCAEAQVLKKFACIGTISTEWEEEIIQSKKLNVLDYDFQKIDWEWEKI